MASGGAVFSASAPAAGGHDHGAAAAHPDDPAKMSEHMAVLELIKASDATNTAAKNGAWSAAATWRGGAVPGEGARVVIPEGVSVVYDVASEAPLKTVGVYGALHFASDVSTRILVDTLVVAPSGRIEIDTQDPDVSTVVTIADDGPIDIKWDPQLLSRGLISHGEARIRGATKTTFLKVAAPPMKGAKTLTLEKAPSGWRVGDRLVVTGTRLVDPVPVDYGKPRIHDRTQDEAVTVTGVEGATVAFAPALKFDHKGPRPDLKAYVANYSRNVRIESEKGAQTPISERGHAMFMHSDKIDVRYAEFCELGRTDKSRRALDVDAVSPIAADANVKGRYALHIHRTGVADPARPVFIVGNAVWGSPGWGFVHHDSNAVFAENAAYDVFGAAFVAETGNEIGRWAHNISIRTIGANLYIKDGDDVGAGDVGRQGVGFWFTGRAVDVVRNVAAGAPDGIGFAYFHRVAEKYVIKADPKTIQSGEKLRYADAVYPNEPNIQIFEDNEALAVGQGLIIIKSGPRQNNDSRSLITRFTGWEVNRGVHLEYTAHYTLSDLDLVSASRSQGQNRIALEYGANAFDMTLNRGRIDGFTDAVHLTFDPIVDPAVREFDYDFIDLELVGNDRGFFDLGKIPHAKPRILSAANLRSGPLAYAFAGPTLVTPPANWTTGRTPIEGTKTDGLGAHPTSNLYDPFTIDWFAARNAFEANGAWRLADGRRATVIEEYFTDRVSGDMDKRAIWVAEPETPKIPGDVRPAVVDRGLRNADNRPPTARDDAAQVAPGAEIDIDVVANDSDPDGDPVRLSAVFSKSGHVVKTAAGKVRYFADIDFQGTDEFWYWAEDDQGGYSKARATVTAR